MNKKISLSLAITIAIIAMTVTFSVTMVLAGQHFNNTVSSVKEKENMYSKLAEIDKYVRDNAYYEINDDTLNDTIASGYMLGTGDRGYEDFFRWKAGQYPGRVSAQILYAEDLSRRVYAAADLFLMPSRSEPCGLSQMIAMRYGAVPIVRSTGGLADTVRSCQVGQEDGTGYLFGDYDAGAMLSVIGQATGLYRGDRTGFDTVRYRGMTADFSWGRSAAAYRHIYENL